MAQLKIKNNITKFFFEPYKSGSDHYYFAKKEERISVGRHRRGNTWVQPFIRKQKVNVEDENQSNKTKAKVALGLVGAGLLAAPLAKKQVNKIPELLRKQKLKLSKNKASKLLPGSNLGSGVYGRVDDINEQLVSKTTALSKGLTGIGLDKKEFNLLRELKDTGVVPKVGSKGKRGLGFTMEKVKGESLFDFVHSTLQEPSDEQLKELGRKTAEALKKVHSKGIIHGDLHSNNIIVDRKGNIKIIDFGLGRKSKFKPGTPGFLMEASEDQTRLVSGGFSQNKKWREKFSEGFYEIYRL